ncbi:MAG TPA: biotin/lipoyl-binding protein, partial [Isosphaeraceae bacterium]|nr:biotin/lipoyl-binding protein [Isosphaeraceae bacterium]
MLPILTSFLMVMMLALSGCRQPRTAATLAAVDRPASMVRVVKARQMNVPIIGRPNGTTVALNQVTIRARVKGFLKEKHFVEGSNVKTGQLLLVIDEEPFKAELSETQAKLDAARADLEKASSSKSREVAAAQVDVSQAALDLALVEEKRETNLLARAATSRENVDRVVAARKKNEAQVKADQASLQQTRADYDSNLLIAKANLEKAQADLDVARINLSYCRMFAPIDGRIGELQVKLGNLVGPGTGSAETTSLVSIQQLDPMGV